MKDRKAFNGVGVCVLNIYNSLKPHVRKSKS